MSAEPYNPLQKENLARSIAQELLAREAIPLGMLTDLKGAGVYAIYFSGDFAAYATISGLPDEGHPPIYVGKAIPKGGRKGGLSKDAGSGTALRDRLRQHANSIDEAINLSLSDFWVRYLTVDDIWIPLGENVLIDTFKPLWNRAIDGFGNKDPGRRRSTQYRSPWDVLHRGRTFAIKLAESGLTDLFLLQRVDDYLNGRPLARLPKVIEQQLEEERVEAAEAAEDI